MFVVFRLKFNSIRKLPHFSMVSTLVSSAKQSPDSENTKKKKTTKEENQDYESSNVFIGGEELKDFSTSFCQAKTSEERFASHLKSDPKTALNLMYEYLETTKRGFKLTSEKERLKNPALVFLHGLKAVVKLGDSSHFLGEYKFWWKAVNELLPSFDEDDICEIVQFMGEINFDTRGKLQQHFPTCQHVKLLLNLLFNSGGLTNCNLKSLAALHIGLFLLSNNSDQQKEDKLSHYKQKALNETLERFKEAELPESQEDLLDFGFYASSIVESLSKSGVELEQDALNIILNLIQQICKRNSQLTPEDCISFGFYRKVGSTQIKFAVFLLKANAKPNEANVLNSWFDTTTSFMNNALVNHVLHDKAAKTNEEDFEERKQSKIFNKRVQIATKLCAVSCELALKFDKMDIFFGDEFKKSWREIFAKCVTLTTDETMLRHLFNVVRVAESILKVKSSVTPKFMLLEDDVLTQELWQLIGRKVKEANEMREKRNDEMRSARRTISPVERRRNSLNRTSNNQIER